MPTTASEPAVGQIVDGRYQLEELIGKGGMGVVFRARHVFTHQQVALKLITSSLDTDTMNRFLAEARVAATIGHPAIVEASDANRTAEGQLYIVMELLVGTSLRVAMRRGLAHDDLKRIALELLDAVSAAHARGVVHRDLKPENIYLTSPTGAVKVLDFGIAKMRGIGPTSHGMILGTLEYMAPEQLVDSAAVDARADLWAVGVILYELITGLRPYMGDREQLFQALASEEPTPIQAIAPVSDEIAALFATVLARDPAKRFQTAAQMAGAIRRLTLVRLAPDAPPSLPPLDTAGPTMGTGDAWVKPPERARTISAPPIRTVDGPALASTAIQSATPPSLAPSNPEPRRTRGWLIGGIVAAIAVVVIVILATRSSDEVVIVEDHKARCTAACGKLSGCGLAQRTCEADCDRNLINLACVEGAAECTAAAACAWQTSCGAPPAGGKTCLETLGCHQKCGGLANTACLCECNLQLNPRGALLMGKLFTCHVNHPTNEQFAKHCMADALACQRDETVETVANPTLPRPASGACSAACERLATCELATPSCVDDCEAGRLDLECSNTATTCNDRARCLWKTTCGRPIKTGTLACKAAVECWGKHAVQPMSEQCSGCYDQMTDGAALEFGRYFTCWRDVMERSRDPKFDGSKVMQEKCQPLLMACYGMK
jgi:serine/threonine-protein kinase